MKKIFNYAVLGAMLVASQSFVFANTGEVKEFIKLEPAVQSAKIDMVKINQMNGSVESIPAVATTEAIKLSDEEIMKREQEKVEEISKVLGLDEKEFKGKNVSEVLETLPEVQMNKLEAEGVIQKAVIFLAARTEED